MARLMAMMLVMLIAAILRTSGASETRPHFLSSSAVITTVAVRVSRASYWRRGRFVPLAVLLRAPASGSH